jgi:hypothetical protein
MLRKIDPEIYGSSKLVQTTQGGLRSEWESKKWGVTNLTWEIEKLFFI